MNRFRRISFVSLIALVSLLIAGCQNNPTGNAVTSKMMGHLTQE